MTNHDDVARRAYALYETRGRKDGHDWDDWLDAEREVESLSAQQEQAPATEPSVTDTTSAPPRRRAREATGAPATL